jgi:hypothetical protein
MPRASVFRQTRFVLFAQSAPRGAEEGLQIILLVG